MADQLPDTPEIEPLTRTQVLIAMAVTAIVLLLVAKGWMQLGSVPLLTVDWSLNALLLGAGLGILITLASMVVYRIWPVYQRSADYYLQLVLRPLVWFDVFWLGLLPGLSEELLFRGVMLPAFGFDTSGLVVSSLCFGVLHLSSPRQWPYVIWATIVGFALGLSAIVTDNLVVPVIAHVATNWLSSIVWKLRD
ncbi:MAG: lysostaphin resistance A-like protein [Leptolyngbyaceae cyanobacterium]